nr:hypothetical protein [Tanacetum cinerariifolium]
MAYTSSSSSISSSSDSEENRSNKEYHAVLPPFTENYMPSKRDLRLIDEYFESVFVDVISNIAPNDVKTFKTVDVNHKVVKPVWNNTRRVNHINFANKLTHPHPKRGFVPQAVLTRINDRTARDRAVVSGNIRREVYAVKASGCWVWRPKQNVIDHVSKQNSASLTLKRFDCIDVQGRIKAAQLKEIVDLKKRFKKIGKKEKAAQLKEIVDLKKRVKKIGKKEKVQNSRDEFIQDWYL